MNYLPNVQTRSVPQQGVPAEHTTGVSSKISKSPVFQRKVFGMFPLSPSDYFRVCHAERSEASRHFSAPIGLSTAGFFASPRTTGVGVFVYE
jgi:hypothetical protein